MTKKQCRTPKVSVGTVKKSIAAIASRWLSKKAAQRFASSALLGAFRIQRDTVRSDISLRYVEAEHSQFSMNTRRAPGQVLGYHAEDEFAQFFACTPSPRTCAMPREPHFQYNLNPARCQPTTVSGWTRINACFHPGQSRHNITQNNLSEAATRGCGCRTFKTASCCRRARFSRSKSRRERKKQEATTDKSLTKD